jgi:hypothetical protein
LQTKLVNHASRNKERTMWPNVSPHPIAKVVSLLVFILCSATVAFCQFSSGSTGSDGALNYTVPGTYQFDPTVLGLDPAGDGVFNFTTINIAKGVTLQLSSTYHLNRPVYWLASGNVTINGTIDLSGAAGSAPSAVPSSIVPASGGPGGYGGGIGGALVAGNATLPAPQAGNGPGGGPAPSTPGNANGGNGTFTGNQFLVPLIGGSGGSGGSFGAAGGTVGGGGSGGGGAIIIASSTSITYAGIIKANGGVPGGLGTGYAGGAGSGGTIGLYAPTILDTGSGDSTCVGNGVAHGTLWAGANTGAVNGSNGVIRLEATTLTVDVTDCVGTGPGDPAGPATVQTGPLVALSINSQNGLLTQISVASVNGVIVGNSSFIYPAGFPNATISSPAAVTVNVAAQNIPVGTIPQIIVTSMNSGITQATSCPALAGTFGSSTSSCSVTFPAGGSYGYAKAVW